MTVARFIERPVPPPHYKLVIIRHDVDRFPSYALTLAKIERDLGLTASYYFRIPGTWKQDIILEISEMSYEVSLRYNNIDIAKRNFQKRWPPLLKI